MTHFHIEWFPKVQLYEIRKNEPTLKCFTLCREKLCSIFYNYSGLKAIFYFHKVYQLNLIEIAKYAKKKLFSTEKWSYL